MAESETQHAMTLRAAEYVLGTLDAEDARAFERELSNDAGARAELAYWEHRLGALGLALAPVQPPASVWQRIAAAMDADAPPHANVASGDFGRRGRRSGTGFWRGLAVAASVAAIVMAALLFGSSRQPEGAPASSGEPAYASVIYDEPTGMSWLVTAEAGSHEMSVVAMGDYPVPEGKTLRIWFKPEQGEPVLLGKLPHAGGKYKMTLSDTVAQAMDQPARLMVSMEDATRENINTPAGELMWTSPIARHTG